MAYRYKEDREKSAQQSKLRFELYDYYGIPYGGFDTDGDAGEGLFLSEKQQDRERARTLILGMQGIPKELANRLLKYKEQDQKERQ